MVSVKLYKDLKPEEKSALRSYLQRKENEILPYQTLSFLYLMDDVFGYNNLSLTAISDNGEVYGFLPQWKKGRLLESVPWRDKGGPIYDTIEALDALRRETLRLSRKIGAKGIMWRDFKEREFTQHVYYINVEIDLSKYAEESYWKALSSKVRGKVRQAKKGNLQFRISGSPQNSEIQTFYNIFFTNRRRLGVPAYPIDLFLSYFKHFPEENIKLCEVVSDKGEVLSSLILLHTARIAIDAYSGSTGEGLLRRANDFMIYNVVSFCIQNGIELFDFGADSPLQESLIVYKCKWLGKRRSIESSVWGNAKEMDHNKGIYGPVRFMLRSLPEWPYRVASSLLVR